MCIRDSPYTLSKCLPSDACGTWLCVRLGRSRPGSGGCWFVLGPRHTRSVAWPLWCGVATCCCLSSLTTSAYRYLGGFSVGMTVSYTHLTLPTILRV